VRLVELVQSASRNRGNNSADAEEGVAAELGELSGKEFQFLTLQEERGDSGGDIETVLEDVPEADRTAGISGGSGGSGGTSEQLELLTLEEERSNGSNSGGTILEEVSDADRTASIDGRASSGTLAGTALLLVAAAAAASAEDITQEAGTVLEEGTKVDGTAGVSGGSGGSGTSEQLELLTLQEERSDGASDTEPVLDDVSEADRTASIGRRGGSGTLAALLLVAVAAASTEDITQEAGTVLEEGTEVDGTAGVSGGSGGSGTSKQFKFFTLQEERSDGASDTEPVLDDVSEADRTASIGRRGGSGTLAVALRLVAVAAAAAASAEEMAQETGTILEDGSKVNSTALLLFTNEQVVDLTGNEVIHELTLVLVVVVVVAATEEAADTFDDRGTDLEQAAEVDGTALVGLDFTSEEVLEVTALLAGEQVLDTLDAVEDATADAANILDGLEAESTAVAIASKQLFKVSLLLVVVVAREQVLDVTDTADNLVAEGNGVSNDTEGNGTTRGRVGSSASKKLLKVASLLLVVVAVAGEKVLHVINAVDNLVTDGDNVSDGTQAEGAAGIRGSGDWESESRAGSGGDDGGSDDSTGVHLENNSGRSWSLKNQRE